MKLPPPLNWFYEAWMEFGHVFGRIMSFLILTVLWVVGFGAYGIVMKIGRLFTKTEPKQTYWLDVPHSKDDSLTLQF